MPAPFEIMAAPFDVYVAVVGTAFPDISQAPAAAWFLLGTSGAKNYDEDGITIEHNSTVVEYRPVGLTAPRKAFRTEESLIIGFKLTDVSATQYAKILNQAVVTNTPTGTGLGGNLNFPLLQGMNVNQYALFMRATGDSAGGSGFNTQYDVPIVYQNSDPKPVFKKGEPAALEVQFAALWDSALGFGRYRSQNAAAS